MIRKKTDSSDLAASGPKQETGPIKKHVRKVEEYDVIEPATPPEPAQQRPPTIITVPAREVFEEPDPDPIEELLTRIEEEQGYLLKIYRLTQYAQTGRVGRGAPKAFCGEWPFTSDYLTQVQQLYGPGSYKLELKDSNQRYVKSWVEHIAEPVGSAAKQQQIFPQSAPQSPAQSEGNGLGQLAEMAKQLAVIRRAMGWDAEPQTTRVIEAVPAQSELPLEEKILERLLGLAEKNEPLADRLLGRFLGSAEPKEPSFVEILGEFVKPFVPVIVQTIAQLSQAQPGQTATVASKPQGVISQAPFVSEETQTVNQENFTDEDEPYMDLIERLLRECAQAAATGIVEQASIERGSRWVEEFIRDYPVWAGLLGSLLKGSPETVLASLVLIMPDAAELAKMPIALQWVEALQAKLKSK